jgi:hypothetical protein
MMGGNKAIGTSLSTSYLYKDIYESVLNDVKKVMMEYMAKPKEVLISVDENGDIEAEHFEDVETV